MVRGTDVEYDERMGMGNMAREGKEKEDARERSHPLRVVAVREVDGAGRRATNGSQRSGDHRHGAHDDGRRDVNARDSCCRCTSERDGEQCSAEAFR